MTTTYRSRAQDQRIADEFGQAMHPCSVCGQQTEYATMVSYGARCGRCFNAWVTQGKTYRRNLTADDRRAIVARMRAALQSNGGRAWAYALKDREAAGEVLSIAQRDAWRRALRADLEAA